MTTLRSTMDELFASIRAVVGQLAIYSQLSSDFKANCLEIHKQGPRRPHWNFALWMGCWKSPYHNSDEPESLERLDQMDKLVMTLRRVFVAPDRFEINHQALTWMQQSTEWSWLKILNLHYGTATPYGTATARISFTLVVDERWQMEIEFDWADKYSAEEMFEGVWHAKVDISPNQQRKS